MGRTKRKRTRGKKDESTEDLEPPTKKVKLDNAVEEPKFPGRTFSGMFDAVDMINGGRREKKIGVYDSLEKANKAAKGYVESLKKDSSLVRMYGDGHYDETIEEQRKGYPYSTFLTCGIGSSSHTIIVGECHPRGMQVAYLKKALEKRKLSTKGKKKDLVDRLMKDIEKQKKKK